MKFKCPLCESTTKFKVALRNSLEFVDGIATKKGDTFFGDSPICCITCRHEGIVNDFKVVEKAFHHALAYTHSEGVIIKAGVRDNFYDARRDIAALRKHIEMRRKHPEASWRKNEEVFFATRWLPHHKEK